MSEGRMRQFWWERVSEREREKKKELGEVQATHKYIVEAKKKGKKIRVISLRKIVHDARVTFAPEYVSSSLCAIFSLGS